MSGYNPATGSFLRAGTIQTAMTRQLVTEMGRETMSAPQKRMEAARLAEQLGWG